MKAIVKLPMAIAMIPVIFATLHAADGDIDRGFAAVNFPLNIASQPSPVAALSVTPSASVYTAGTPSTITGAAVPGLNLFGSNGLRTTSFSLESFFRKTSFSDVAIGVDGSVLAAHPRYFLRKFTTAGKEATSFLGYRDFVVIPDCSPVPDPLLTKVRVKVAPDGKIYAFGHFTIEDDEGVMRQGLVRLLPNGQLDIGFTLKIDNSSSAPTFNDIAITASGEVWFAAEEDVGFLIGTEESPQSYGCGKLDVSGQLVVGQSISSAATAIAVLPHGHVLVAFRDGGSAHIRQLDPEANDVDTWQDAGLPPGFGSLIPIFEHRAGDIDMVGPVINVLATQADGKVLVGGDFEAHTDTQTRTNLVRLTWRGDFDSTFVGRTGSAGTVMDLQMHTDGKIMVGGNFDQINGEARRGLVRLLNNTGAGWGTTLPPPYDPPPPVMGTKPCPSLQFLPGWYYCTSFSFKDGFAFHNDRCFVRLSVGQDSARVEELIVSPFDEELTDPKVLELGTGATYAPSMTLLQQAAVEISKGQISNFPCLVWGPGTVFRTSVCGTDIIAFNAEGPLVAFTSGLAGFVPYEPATAVVPGGFYKRIPGTSTAVGSNVGQMYSGFYPGTPAPYAGSPRIIQFVTQKTNGVSFYMGLFHIQTPGSSGITLTTSDITSPDKTAPIVTFKYPANNTKYSSEAATIAGTVTETGWIDSVEWRLNGGDWQPAYGKQRWTAQVKPLLPGTNNIEIRAKDGAANISRPITPLKIIRL
jgi:hypothetical protein